VSIRDIFTCHEISSYGRTLPAMKKSPKVYGGRNPPVEVMEELYPS
jgi:hypothetical protein